MREFVAGAAASVGASEDPFHEISFQHCQCASMDGKMGSISHS